MRTNILMVCGIILALCIWLLLHHAKEQTKVRPQDAAVLLTNNPLAIQPVQPPVSEQHQSANAPAPIKVSPAKKDPWPTAENSSQQALAPWYTPIEFYGKVIDENSNPVAGVSVHFRWATQTEDIALTTSTTESDVGGLFSLQGKRGRSLDVSISKEGYYNSRRDKTGFLYALGSDIYSPSMMNPVIFHLRKKTTGENLISVKQNYRVSRDGTQLGINLTTGKSVIGGSDDVIVQCWTDDQGKRSGQRYDWHCLVTIPGGGLVLSDEEFAFLAPENGYVPSAEIKMSAGRLDWKNDVDLKFYYQLPNGDYGRMIFSMIAGGDHFCMIDSLLNPSGSRNLEQQ